MILAYPAHDSRPDLNRGEIIAAMEADELDPLYGEYLLEQIDKEEKAEREADTKSL